MSTCAGGHGLVFEVSMKTRHVVLNKMGNLALNRMSHLALNRISRLALNRISNLALNKVSPRIAVAIMQSIFHVIQ